MTDNNQDGLCGNYTVFPGGHHMMKQFSKLNDGYENFKKNGLDDAK